MRPKMWLLIGLALTSLTLAACASPETEFSVGMVTDTGGIEDESFNAKTWAGLTQAQEDYGAEISFIESESEADFDGNINQFIEDDYNLIVTTGFLLGDATLAAAQANPETQFAIVDYGYASPPENLLGITFQTDEAAFLAGYLAAGMSETGIVGMFGGLDIPTVTIFMDGFRAGVNYYNGQQDADVQVVGQDLFIETFDESDADAGREAAELLINEGADIIMPVAGGAGFGAIEAAEAAEGVLLIGVDTDWCEIRPSSCPYVITSVTKNLDVAVYNAISQAVDDEFVGGTYEGTVSNGGVDIAPYHDFETTIDGDLLAQVEQLRFALIVNTLPVAAYVDP